MAISSASAIVPEKMQFPRGTEVHNLTYQWFPDERDGFHLRTTGEPDEYDMVFRSIQQRRCNWAPVLYMQQYFSISDVNLTLQQVAWRKQQRRFDQPKVNGKDFKKSNVGYRQVRKLDNRRENQNCSTRADAQKIEEESDLGEEIQRRASVQVPDENLSPEVSQKDGPCDDNAPKAAKFSAEAVTNQEGEDKDFPAQSFLYVNHLDGLKLYEGLFKVSEISSMISAVNEWRIAGRKGEFQGKLYISPRLFCFSPPVLKNEYYMVFVPIEVCRIDEDNSSNICSFHEYHQVTC
ncbi:unnamed protein product [Spirodela intermedia]|uniref:Uncharacterized protein n=1 Tax=Spirodela intermedia TaxID=51605 RepID=A0A7I8J3Y8_SPIIN|nr:unnamed protein product [Spirodela intermedia]CAA6664744.1 unnamed protein product [Spirodela intermedia]